MITETTAADATETYLRAAEVAQLAHEIAAGQIAAAKRAEDHRANRRNRNASLTMIIALIMALWGPTLLPMLGLSVAYASLAIIVADSIVRAWAFIKRY
jgi:hypothetical protein